MKAPYFKYIVFYTCQCVGDRFVLHGVTELFLKKEIRGMKDILAISSFIYNDAISRGDRIQNSVVITNYKFIDIEFREL